MEVSPLIIARNNYIFEYVIKKSELSFPNLINGRKAKGYTELARKFRISSSRVHQIYVSELWKHRTACNHRLSPWNLCINNYFD